jgi:hypothetical protein
VNHWAQSEIVLGERGHVHEVEFFERVSVLVTLEEQGGGWVLFGVPEIRQ